MSNQSIPEFRAIPGFPGYRATSNGEIQSCLMRKNGGWQMGESWKTLRPSNDKAGRPCVALGKNSGTIRVCRLILLAFVGPCPAGKEVCHADGNPGNNQLDNLSWGTHTENMADRIKHGRYARGSQHHEAKVTEEDVVLMRQLRRQGWSYGRLTKRFPLAKTTITQIVKGQFWRHVEE